MQDTRNNEKAIEEHLVTALCLDSSRAVNIHVFTPISMACHDFSVPSCTCAGMSRNIYASFSKLLCRPPCGLLPTRYHNLESELETELEATLEATLELGSDSWTATHRGKLARRSVNLAATHTVTDAKHPYLSRVQVIWSFCNACFMYTATFQLDSGGSTLEVQKLEVQC